MFLILHGAYGEIVKIFTYLQIISRIRGPIEKI